jgi:sucrose phosphorylase
MTEMGYIQPDPEMLKPMFFRKPGLPLLMVQMPDHRQVPYWNTFYQKVMEPQGREEGKLPSYLGQMDLNIQSPLVWDHYRQTIHRLAGYGAKIIRLDAFAYAHKQPGERNFLNEPGTWDFLEEIRELAEPYGITLLPEIHESYEKKCYARLAEKGYMTYDFFLPGLMLDALERQQGDILEKWATELAEKQIRVVNMLGCHDGIPLLDLKGLLPEDNINRLIELVISRGGYVKDLHGQQGKGMYYQVNATYFSALGEDEKKLLLARAIQLFMPGKPQVWYLDLFAGCNDYEAMARAGEGGHKEINRTNLTREQIEEGLHREVVTKQLEMLRFRNTYPAFGFTSAFSMESSGSKVRMTWSKDGYRAELSADLTDCTYEISYNGKR